MPFICCICEKPVDSTTGNNPYPFFPMEETTQDACDSCDSRVITPARIAGDVDGENWREKLVEYREKMNIRVN